MVPDDSQLLVDVRVGIGDDMGQGDLLAGYEYLDDALLVLGLKYLLRSVGHSHSLLSRKYANLLKSYINVSNSSGWGLGITTEETIIPSALGVLIPALTDSLTAATSP